MKTALYVLLVVLFMGGALIVVRRCNGSHPHQDGYRQGEQAGHQDFVFHNVRETEGEAKKEAADAGESDTLFVDGYWAGYQTAYPEQ